MRIREMAPADYEQLSTLWRSCAGMGLNDRDDSRAGITRFLERNPESCFVAEEKGEIIGAILAGNDGRRGYIYHTAVSPAHQRRGIGTELVRAALQALEHLGIAKVALVVFDRNASGNRFWERLGFQPRPDLVYRDHALVELVKINT